MAGQDFQPTRILFFTWLSLLRRFVDTVSELADGGHEVVIASPSQMPPKLPRRLQTSPRVRLALYDEVSDPEYGRAIATLRQARDYAWYLSPEQRIASFNRRHALERKCRRQDRAVVRLRLHPVRPRRAPARRAGEG